MVAAALVGLMVFHHAAPDTTASPPPAGAQTVLLLGDSMAQVLGRSFRRVGKSRGWHTVNQGVFACVSIDAPRVRFLGSQILPLEECRRRRDLLPTWAAEYRPEHALILESGALAEFEIDGSWANVCDPRFASRYEEPLRRSVETLESHGVTAWIATAATPNAQDLRAVGTLNLDPEEVQSRLQVSVDCQNVVRRRVAATTSAHVLDVERWLCGGGTCREEIDDVRLRPDGIHFKGRGAEIVAEWIWGQLGVPSDVDGGRLRLRPDQSGTQSSS